MKKLNENQLQKVEGGISCIGAWEVLGYLLSTGSPQFASAYAMVTSPGFQCD